jgi:putative SOS response-associated peptidase YedK
MCNLYDLDVAPPFLKERFRLKRVPDAAGDHRSGAVGMVRPSVKAPVIRLDADGEPVCSLMEWGFVRQWKNGAGKLTLQRIASLPEVFSSSSSMPVTWRGCPASAAARLPAALT